MYDIFSQVADAHQTDYELVDTVNEIDADLEINDPLSPFRSPRGIAFSKERFNDPEA